MTRAQLNLEIRRLHRIKDRLDDEPARLKIAEAIARLRVVQRERGHEGIGHGNCEPGGAA